MFNEFSCERNKNNSHGWWRLPEGINFKTAKLRSIDIKHSHIEVYVVESEIGIILIPNNHCGVVHRSTEKSDVFRDEKQPCCTVIHSGTMKWSFLPDFVFKVQKLPYMECILPKIKCDFQLGKFLTTIKFCFHGIFISVVASDFLATDHVFHSIWCK